MKTLIPTLSLLVLAASPTFAQNYSAYKIVASKRLNACYPANKFKGKDISPNKLLAKYPCEIRNQNDSLGAIFIYCEESPYGEGKAAFLYIRDARDCDKALEALQQM
ncbi:MAG: hypothetical protein ACOY5B_18870 [Spirochaetota bacterium]